MQRIKAILPLAMLIAALVMITANKSPMLKDYEKKWKQVDSLNNLRQPRSAIKIVDRIHELARQEDNVPQMIRANLYRIKLMSEFEEDYMVKAIERIGTEIEDAETPERQLLQSILGELYTRYYQMNRHQILERGIIAGEPSGDIRTWDAATLIRAARDNYIASLEQPKELQNIDLQKFSAILEEEKGSKAYRPTLYDFLAFRAIGFFANTEMQLPVAALQYVPKNSGLLAPAAEFIEAEIDQEYRETNTALAIRTFQNLLRFHSNHSDPQAFIDADLHRLDFIYQKIRVGHKDSLYLRALRQLKERFLSSPHHTNVSYRIARFYDQQGARYNPLISEDHRWDRKKAVELCEEAIGAFPESRGAENCRVLLSQITEPGMNITLESAILPEKPSPGLIQWKNVSQAYFRVLAFDQKEFLLKTWRSNRRDLALELAKMNPVKQWDVQLPNEPDYQQHSAEFKIPAVGNGFYILLASNREDFAGDDVILVWADFISTNLSYISQRDKDGGYEIYVLARGSGDPVKDVSVTLFARDYNYNTRSYNLNQKKTFRTDKNGYVRIDPVEGERSSVNFEFTKDGDRFFTSRNFFLNTAPEREPRPQPKSYFFTDRSIYRPGQTVYFKTIILEKTGDEYVIMKNEQTTIEFLDVNRQVVASQKLTTGDYGSVNGSFTIPSGLLTGRMTLKNESGSTEIRVEEYKRPTFRVDFDPVKGSYKVGEEVAVTGTAQGYAGNSIDGAEVSYRVVRRSFFPFIGYGYYGILPPSPEVEITSGKSLTDESGAFRITFEAIPDYDLPQRFKPVFHYTVTASVTDISGETQSGSQVVDVGYQSLYIKTEIPENISTSANNTFSVTAENLNGQKLDKDISVEVFQLQPPERLMVERKWQQPDTFLMTKEAFRETFPHRVYKNEDQPEHWIRANMMFLKTLSGKKDTMLTLEGLESWQPGKYLVKLSATDAFGEKVETKKYFTLYNRYERRPPLPVYNFFVPLKDQAEPGEEAVFLIGTSAKNVQVLFEVQHDDRVVSREWMKLSNRQEVISVPVKEAYRGNFGVQLTYVIKNRIYKNSMTIEVPFTNKKLDLAFETFRSELEPGGSENWTITIRDKQGDKVAAEMLASMYDASLDAFVDHNWNFNLYTARFGFLPWNEGSSFTVSGGAVHKPGVRPRGNIQMPSYDRLNWFGFSPYGRFMDSGGRPMPLKGEGRETGEQVFMSVENEQKAAPPDQQPPENGTAEKETDGMAGIPLRQDFNETAFFYPDLKTDETGNVQIKFTLPESFTKWKFMGLAYTKNLMTGFLKQEFTASKKLMIFPNAPRFFRSGDTLSFSVRITNMSDEDLSGTTRLEFFDAIDMTQAAEALNLQQQEKSFDVRAGESTSVKWQIIIPEDFSMLSYRIKATSGNFTDGIESSVPVLPNRMMVTESMPMPVGGDEQKNFRFEKLLESSRSNTADHYKLTLEFASNPAWYAVQALPVIAEPVYQNTISIFASFFANSISFHIANANPRIRRVFESWKSQSPEAFLSELEKNQDLKQIVLGQTPWVLEAQSQAERKRRIALLFDINNMQNQLDASIRKLEKLQTSNGGFSWFEGMPDSRYITQYVVLGIGKLHRMGVIDAIGDARIEKMMNSAIRYLDERIHDDYTDLKKRENVNMEKDHLSALQIQYLLARTNFGHIMLNPSYETAYNYYRNQAEQFWQDKNPYLQGMIAIALFREGNKEIPRLIIKSLKERALHSDEMGMYWRQNPGYYWYQSDLSFQALMIEAFAEISGDAEAVEDMKIWLLKQKQTQDWGNARATADAVSALLSKGRDLLVKSEPVQIKIGGERLDDEIIKTEAGTGYFQVSWKGKEINPEMGEVSVTNRNEGIAWGALYWQYFQDLDKITPHETPLSINKALYLQKNTDEGQVLEPLESGARLNVGDRVVVRVELRVDRDMEFVHMKDMRAAAFEPVNVLSGYRHRGGLGFYQATGDAATNFFFDDLRKGTFVFEYPLVATQEGNFSNGITTIQSMYAPEFTSHSKGIRVTVE